MGNRSKRGRRRDVDGSDPATEWQDEARWSGFTRHIRWPSVAGPEMSGRPGRSRMPPLRAWLGIAVVVGCLLGAIWLFLWLVSLVLA
jgi:hypothetical protein